MAHILPSNSLHTLVTAYRSNKARVKEMPTYEEKFERVLRLFIVYIINTGNQMAEGFESVSKIFDI